jgi:hypothetical protein
MIVASGRYTSAMAYALDTLRTFLDENRLNYREGTTTGKCPALGWCGAGRTGTFEVHALDSPEDYLWIYVVAPIRISEARRARVAELLAHVNYGFRFGTFELDLADGELRFRSGGFVPKGEAGKDVVAELYENGRLMDQFFEILVEATFSPEPVAVAWRRLSPAMAGGGEKKEPSPNVSEVLAWIDEIGRQPAAGAGEEPRA